MRKLEDLEGDREVILVDGGSTDRTVRMIEEAGPGVQLLHSVRGRAGQMNRGAAAAKGGILLFLHADASLPAGALRLIENAFGRDDCIGGGFSLAIDDGAPIYKLIAYFSNLRARFLGQLFGDQAIFIRSEVFERLGGFEEIELMEDMDFSRRARKMGRMIQLPDRVESSARRWKRNGVWRTIWLMQKIKLMYFMGVSPGKLKKMYADVR